MRKNALTTDADGEASVSGSSGGSNGGGGKQPPRGITAAIGATACIWPANAVAVGPGPAAVSACAATGAAAPPFCCPYARALAWNLASFFHLLTVQNFWYTAGSSSTPLRRSIAARSVFSL